MGVAKLVFLSFEPKIGPCIKLKRLKSYIKYKKIKTVDKKEMPKKYESSCNFEKYDKFPLKVLGVCLSPEVSKFFHQIQLFNSFHFHLIYGPFCVVKHFNSKLRKT